MQNLDTDQAHARRTDPSTSHEAARAATIYLSTIQRQVLRFAEKMGAGGFGDIELENSVDDHGATFRTRRCELTRMKLIKDSGRRFRVEGDIRDRIVWQITAAGMARNGHS